MDLSEAPQNLRWQLSRKPGTTTTSRTPTITTNEGQVFTASKGALLHRAQTCGSPPSHLSLSSMHVLMRALSHPNRSTDWSPPQRPSAACNALSPPACYRRRSHRRRHSARSLCCRWSSLTAHARAATGGTEGHWWGRGRARWPGYDRPVAHSHAWCRRHVWRHVWKSSRRPPRTASG